MKKKILSLLLAVVMLASVLPMSAISAYATTYSSDVKINTLYTGDIVKRGVKIMPYTGYCWVDGKNYYSSTGNSGWTAPTCVSLTVTRGTGIGANANIKVTTTNACNSNTQGTLKTAATCTAAAVYNYKCSICGTNTATKSVGSPSAHSYTKQGALVTAATCTSPAVYKKQCATCTATSGTMEVGSAKGHTWVNATIDAPKTCSTCKTTEGSKLPSAVISYVDPSTGETVEKKATNDTVKTIVDELLSKPMQNNKKGIFLGWFADGEALQKGTSRFDILTNITAGYTPVNQIEKDFNDDKMIDSYKSFGLAGVQIREDNTQESYEYGYDELEGQVYGGLRYVASFSEQLKSIVESNANVEYGFVMASRANAEMFADHYGVAYDKYEIKYNTGVNGGTADTDYRYVTNVVCSNNIDHRNFDGYRLFTAVIDYEDAEGLKDTEFVARAYVKYVDANGNTQIYYDDYDGTTTFGGCSISYNRALAMSR